jgi:hypothetical protein
MTAPTAATSPQTYARVGGWLYLINIANILTPALANSLFPWALLPAFFAELALGLWLIAVGVRPPKLCTLPHRLS